MKRGEFSYRTPASLATFFVLVLVATSTLAATSQPGDQIRRFFEGVDAGDAATVASRPLNEPVLVSRFYRQMNHAPVWLAGAPLADEVDNLRAAIDQSVRHGLSAPRYHKPTIDHLVTADDDSSKIALELLLTDAFLSQALHRGHGAVNPASLDADWHLPKVEVDAASLLMKLAQRPASVLTALDALWPLDKEYAQLLERRAEISASADEATVYIPLGPLLKPGQTNERVRMLKQRLMGPGEYTDLYDADLHRELIAFQRVAGLEPDGIVGADTLEVMNATKVSWIDRIDANLERWRWLPRESPPTYLRVNIAAYTLRFIEFGQQPVTMNVIVGKPYRRTPVFVETLKYLVLNPYWNVPFSIATKDKLPLLKADAAIEEAKGFEVKPHGRDEFVSVVTIDWDGVTPRTFNYQLRQRPGEQNALGRIKFMLPNPFSVYLHDTPNRELFGREERAFSSGCIRLEHPTMLTTWLLSRENHPDMERIESLLTSGTTHTVYLKQPVATYLVYFTAFVDDGGRVVFRRDVYQRDRAIFEALREQEA